MGRKRKDQARRKAPADRTRKPYHLHLSDDERKLVIARAEKEGRTEADVLRRLITKHLQPREAAP